MGLFNAARTMADGFIILLLVALAAGQSVVPSNATLPASMTGVDIFLSLAEGRLTIPSKSIFNIAPLTTEAGQGQNANSLSALHQVGNIQLTNSSSADNLTTSDIAYINCDTSENSTDPSSVVGTAGDSHPRAIVLYSLTSSTCNLTGSYPYTSLYSVTSSNDSNLVFNTIRDFPDTNILMGTIFSNATSNPQDDSNNGGPAPTTAVAMSILYSITGIITLLFLIIIGTGAIRAHRHPERYGPRSGGTGRTRQSRAKGLARAMLETLPIVKFGDPEPEKPGARDVEMEDGNQHNHSLEAEGGSTGVTISGASGVNVAAGQGPQYKSESEGSQDSNAAKEGNLGCSICTEDFTTGEDVRVLPCNHKYHPACIDPWLLNVSGTCPLCRHDLRPAPSRNEENDGDVSPIVPTADDAYDLAPPLAGHEGEEAEGSAVAAENGEASNAHRRRSRFLDLHRLRHAPPAERIAALRQLRQEARAEGQALQNNTDVVEERSRRARLTSRLRDTFRIKTRTQAVPEAERSEENRVDE